MEFNFKVEVVEKYETTVMLKFSGEGLSTINIGAPYPPENVDPADFYEQYAPLHLWIEEATPRQDLELGAVFNKKIKIGPPEHIEQAAQTETVTLVLETHSV